MLSNHLQNGAATANVAWSRLPSAEEDGDDGEVGTSKKIEGSSVESLDYEVIENYAYRREQVSVLTLLIFSKMKDVLHIICGEIVELWFFCLFAYVIFMFFWVYRLRKGSYM